jgi:hypothetical protein
MNNRKCRAIAELLVDYGDGDLTEADRRRVEAHLGECPACRSQSAILRRSLELAQSVWHAAAEAGPYRQGSPWRVRLGGLPSARVPVRNRLAVAAVILAAVLLAVLGPWLARRSQQVGRARPEEGTAGQLAAPQPKPTPPVPAPHDEPPLDAILASETRAARLAASIEILASQPGLEEFKDSAQRYLATTYPGTAAAQRAAAPRKRP